jgi:hypothetical protein
MDQQVSRELHAAVGALAARCAWSAFDTASHEAARSLFRLALYAAARAEAPDIRAHVLADVAARHNYLGYHEDCLEIVRFTEGDERVTPAVRMILHGVKARAYAAINEPALCSRHIDLAEQAFTTTHDAPGWVGTLRHPAHLYAATGHAIAALAHHGAGDDAAEAQKRLGQAVDGFDPAGHARALALCMTRLARLHLAAGSLDEGVHWAHQALTSAASVSLARLYRDLATIRAVADDTDAPLTREIVTAIDTLTGTDE